MDPKSQRSFVTSVVSHLQKSLRAYDGKDPEALVKTLEEATSMIKFVSGGKKKVHQKRGRKKKVAGTPPASETPAAEST